MKTRYFYLVATGLMMFALLGCDKKAETADSAAKTTDVVVLEADICGGCGCCKGCDDCCKGETCGSCGYQKGTSLCCVEGAPAPNNDAIYCKGCGFEKGGAKCCAEGNETCTKCGLAKGSPICCKVNVEKLPHSHEGGEADHDHGGDKDAGHDHDGDHHDEDQDS